MPARIHQFPVRITSGTEALARTLDRAAVSSRRTPCVPGPFRLRARLDQALRLLAGSARRKNVVLALDVPFEVPDTLLGDARALRRTLADLVALSIRRVEGGDVAVHVSVASQTVDEVMLRFAVTAADATRGTSTFAFRARFGLPGAAASVATAAAPVL
jgi:signal transduction histidine kinase